MSRTNRTIDLRCQISKDDIPGIRRAVEEMEIGEELTLVVERQDAHETDPIFSVLDEYGLDYQSRSGRDGGYRIVAKTKGDGRDNLNYHPPTIT
ncbi:MAG: hypothetical protein AB1331_06935 [Bacillota bacterium]